MDQYQESRDFEIGMMLQGDPRATAAHNEFVQECLADEAYYESLAQEYYAEQAAFKAQLDELEGQGIFARLLLHPEYNEDLSIEDSTHGPVQWVPYDDNDIPF